VISARAGMIATRNRAIEKVTVIGAGAWGTALALLARRAGRATMLWAHEPEVAATINAKHVNPQYLPGVPLDRAIAATTDLAAAVDGAEAVVLAVPAQFLRAVAVQLNAHLADAPPFVVCAKGIERGTLKLMSEVLAETCPGAPIAVLSGPTFAGEVARGLPTAVTLAIDNFALGRRLIAAIGTATFRPYLADDLVGAQIGGAVKNVIAIACGIVVGRGLGDNARAALMTRGLAEIMRVGDSLGAKRETLIGLSGLGDLALTCNSPQSRNMALGIALGQGLSLEQALAGKRSVAEGVASAQSAADLARARRIDMPIVAAVEAILHRGADIDLTIATLLARPFKAET
jgi:glycerol-3-phosphate dehydrogenase (NAD(P)+)